MVVKKLYLWDYLLINCIFSLSKLIGALPSYVDGRKLTIDMIVQQAVGFKKKIEHAKTSIASGVIYTAANFILMLSWIDIFYRGCSLISIRTTANIAMVYLLILISIAFQRNSKVKCLYSLSRISFITPPARMIRLNFIFTVACYIAVFYFSFIESRGSVFLTVLVVFLFVPISTTNILVSIFGDLAEQAYQNVNLQLSKLKTAQPSRKTLHRINILMFHHEIITDLIEEINYSFNYALVVLLVDFTQQLIFTSYGVSSTVTYSKHIPLISLTIEMLLFCIKFNDFYLLCNSSQRIQNQVLLLSANLQSMKTLFLSYKDYSFRIVVCFQALYYINNTLFFVNNRGWDYKIKFYVMLSDFFAAVNANTSVLRAAGLTTIDLSLIFQLTGAAVMYTSAALQYYWQDDDD